MSNKQGNGANGNYMENMDCEIKHIDKIEDLNGFTWEHNGRTLRLAYERQNDLINVFLNNFREYWGLNNRCIFMIKIFNLNELEFLGLKVILNEKPKLTRKERYLLESHKDFIHIVRSRNDTLCIHDSEPKKCSSYWDKKTGYNRLVISEDLFKFITWESGKAWSKEELMELEVVE